MLTKQTDTEYDRAIITNLAVNLTARVNRIYDQSGRSAATDYLDNYWLDHTNTILSEITEEQKRRLDHYVRFVCNI